MWGASVAVGIGVARRSVELPASPGRSRLRSGNDCSHGRRSGRDRGDARDAGRWSTGHRGALRGERSPSAVDRGDARDARAVCSRALHPMGHRPDERRPAVLSQSGPARAPPGAPSRASVAPRRGSEARAGRGHASGRSRGCRGRDGPAEQRREDRFGRAKRCGSGRCGLRCGCAGSALASARGARWPRPRLARNQTARRVYNFRGTGGVVDSAFRWLGGHSRPRSPGAEIDERSGSVCGGTPAGW
jgi:hypothetical protein